MSRLKDSEIALFEGLKSLSESAFPKVCNYCGQRFETVEVFLTETERLARGSSLKASRDDDDQSILELYRNCVCGSTLMDFFTDRRETNERGLKRRERFGKLIRMLEERGIETALARKELLTIMRGGHSRTLEALGLKFRGQASSEGSSTPDDS